MAVSGVNRKAAIKQRIANREGEFKCSVWECGRPTMAAAGVGLSQHLCRYHVQWTSRHGSPFCTGTYKASELRPYLRSAAAFLKHYRRATIVDNALRAIAGLLYAAGPVEPVMNIKRWSAGRRARVAFARLREARVQPERILALHLAMAALIEDDAEAPRTTEFRRVQTAKLLHRRASGTHKRWPGIPGGQQQAVMKELVLPSGAVKRVVEYRRTPAYPSVEMHAYPKSSGKVLRVMGQQLDEVSLEVTQAATQTVIELRTECYGPHPSKLPGYVPRWKRLFEQRRGA
jgi:hypothetical protein